MTPPNAWPPERPEHQERQVIEAPDCALQPGESVLGAFTRTCRRSPSIPAIRWGERVLSYGDLELAVSGVETLLENCRLNEGSFVAVLLSDRIRLIATMIALFRRRCVFVPVDPDGPLERIGAILADSDPEALFTEEALRNTADLLRRIEGVRCTVVSGDGPCGGVVTRRCRPHFPDSVAYLYFTSGSTGRPKGVMGSLEAASQFIAWEMDYFGFGRGCRVSQLTSPAFDPFLRDVFVALCGGGTICIPPEPPPRMAAEDLIGWLQGDRVQVVHCVPSLFAAMAGADPSAGGLDGLSHVFVAGETLRSFDVQQWRKRFGNGAEIINLYGATETTMVKLFHVVESADLLRPVIPIGRPIRGAGAWLLDEEGRPCPPGTIGEIHIRSRYLALGYYGDEEMTRKVYPADFKDASTPGSVYRSGDYGCLLADGTLEFVGRRDDQVKIRGVRVELGEIRAALERHPSIREAAVVCRTEPDGESWIHAFLLLDGADQVNHADLRAFLRRFLSWEMIPESFTTLEEYPRTPNGKLDRQRLPQLPRAGVALEAELMAPRNDLERVIAEIWCKQLGLERVGVTQNFFELGGHSLSAMRIVSRLHSLLERPIPFAAVLMHPTVAGMAELLTSDNPGAAEAAHRPSVTSAVESEVRYNLVIVVNEQIGRASFDRLAREIRQIDPAIDVVVLEDSPHARPGLPARPTMVFGPALVRNRTGLTGRILCGAPLSKGEEYAALARIGIPLPQWEVLTEQHTPDLSRFGRYVVTKPDHGAKGAEVRLRLKKNVRWKPVVTGTAGESAALIVQEFIYTGRTPSSYKVSTLFGEPLYAVRFEAGCGRLPLVSLEEIEAGQKPVGVSVVSTSPDSKAELAYDREVIDLAISAQKAFPDIPLLGVDILRELPSGKLYVIEVNAIGYAWNFSDSGPRAYRIEIEQQFDGFRKAARLLAEKTRELAD
jgi:amino acid adenylation domain-containing protein